MIPAAAAVQQMSAASSCSESMASCPDCHDNIILRVNPAVTLVSPSSDTHCLLLNCYTTHEQVTTVNRHGVALISNFYIIQILNVKIRSKFGYHQSCMTSVSSTKCKCVATSSAFMRAAGLQASCTNYVQRFTAS